MTELSADWLLASRSAGARELQTCQQHLQGTPRSHIATVGIPVARSSCGTSDRPANRLLGCCGVALVFVISWLEVANLILARSFRAGRAGIRAHSARARGLCGGPGWREPGLSAPVAPLVCCCAAYAACRPYASRFAGVRSSPSTHPALVGCVAMAAAVLLAFVPACLRRWLPALGVQGRADYPGTNRRLRLWRFPNAASFVLLPGAACC